MLYEVLKNIINFINYQFLSHDIDDHYDHYDHEQKSFIKDGDKWDKKSYTNFKTIYYLDGTTEVVNLDKVTYYQNTSALQRCCKPL